MKPRVVYWDGEWWCRDGSVTGRGPTVQAAINECVRLRAIYNTRKLPVKFA